MCTLVGSEATTEADKQSVGVDPLEDGDRRLGVTTIADPLLAVEGTDMLDEAKLDTLMRLPKHFVGDLLHLSPSIFARLVLEVIFAEVLAVEVLPFGRSPRRKVHTISDIAHMKLFGEEALPHGGEHLLRHLAMQEAHTIGFLTGVQSEDAHGELLIAIGTLTPEAHEVMPRDAEAVG